MHAVMTVDLSELDAWSAQVQRASDDLTGIARNGGNSLVQTDFGPILSLFFRDPDGLEAEVCVVNPDAEPGVHHPPGTPARRYHPDAGPPS